MNAVDVRNAIARAERMTLAASGELTRGNTDDTQEFLRAAVRNLNVAIQMLETQSKVVEMPRSAKR